MYFPQLESQLLQSQHIQQGASVDSSGTGNSALSWWSEVSWQPAAPLALVGLTGSCLYSFLSMIFSQNPLVQGSKTYGPRYPHFDDVGSNAAKMSWWLWKSIDSMAKNIPSWAQVIHEFLFWTQQVLLPCGEFEFEELPSSRVSFAITAGVDHGKTHRFQRQSQPFASVKRFPGRFLFTSDVWLRWPRALCVEGREGWQGWPNGMLLGLSQFLILFGHFHIFHHMAMDQYL